MLTTAAAYLAQINFPSDETVGRLLDSRIDQVASIIVLGVVILLISSVAAIVLIARIVGRGIDRQNDALDNERKEKRAALDENRELVKRVDDMERRLTDSINDAKLKALEADKDREILMTRVQLAEEQVQRLRDDLKQERQASMIVLAENERLRNENGTLKTRIEQLEQRIADLEKRATNERPAANGNPTPESKIDTEPLTPKQEKVGD